MFKKAFILFLIALILTSCAPAKSPISLELITLSHAEYTLPQGNSLTLQVNFQPENASNKTISWSSSNPQVATVTGGVVTAVGPGAAVITVTAEDGELAARCVVTVTVPVKGVSIDETELKLSLGSSHQLKAETIPANATDQVLVWSSSNPQVAEVNQEGLVTALALGKADITVAAGDSQYSAVCKVEVTAISVTGVTVNITTAELLKGDKTQLTATVAPGNATDKSLTWSSSNTKVASVDASGLVTATGPGSAIITVTTTDGAKTAQCSITVYERGSGNSHGNLNAGGNYAWYQGHIYFSFFNGFSQGSLYKQPSTMQGSSQQLHTDPVACLNIVDGWIYYVHRNSHNIYRIRTDGTGRQKLVDKSAGDLNVADGWMFFSVFEPSVDPDPTIYRCRLDGTGLQQISKQFGQDLRAADGWLYYRSLREFALYRMRYDGSNKQKIYSKWTGQMVISGNWIYFVEEEEARSTPIYRIKTDGTSKQELGIGGLNIHVVGDWLYYARFSSHPHYYEIVRTKVDGSSTQVLDSSKNYWDFYILGDWILYRDYYSGKRMRLDGSEKSNIKH